MTSPCAPRPLRTAGGASRRDFRFDNTRSLPVNWRERLPAPADYYSRCLPDLTAPNSAGWAQARCRLHDDGERSLSVNLTGARGAWKCFAGCGCGDIVAFHERRMGFGFVDAVRDLVLGAR